MMMDGWDVNGWEWLWMVLMMAPGIVLVTLLVFLVARGWAVPSRSPEAETPDEILRKRYAAGDIDDEEFLRRRDALHSLS